MAFQYAIHQQMEKEHAQWFQSGRAEGHTAGLAEGHVSSILALLEDKGNIPDSLRKRIMEQKDMDVLKRWLKLAAKSDSVEEFSNRIQ